MYLTKKPERLEDLLSMRAISRKIGIYRIVQQFVGTYINIAVNLILNIKQELGKFMNEVQKYDWFCS